MPARGGPSVPVSDFMRRNFGERVRCGLTEGPSEGLRHSNYLVGDGQLTYHGLHVLDAVFVQGVEKLLVLEDN